MKLAYQDLSADERRRNDKMKKLDPKKQEQSERLGMGFGGSGSGVSHSVMNDMQTIKQETPMSHMHRNTYEDRYSASSRSHRDNDDFEIIGGSGGGGFHSGPPK